LTAGDWRLAELMSLSPEPTHYDLPDVLRVDVDGPIRIITLNRPDELNAINRELDGALAKVFSMVSDDQSARVAVVTGAGRAFSAGGDIGHIQAMCDDKMVREESLDNGKRVILSMIRCRVPVIAAVNGPAVGLGCSVLALSDIVYMADTAFIADPHVPLGLVAGDGGPLSWPAHMSLMLAKEYLLTGDRISAERAAQIGLVNHVVPTGDVLTTAVERARSIARLPQQAVEDTKRLLNLHLERSVVGGMDFAFSAEARSFDTEDLRRNVAGFLDGRAKKDG
jgi:enoyl-CoA hydratase